MEELYTVRLSASPLLQVSRTSGPHCVFTVRYRSDRSRRGEQPSPEPLSEAYRAALVDELEQETLP